MLPSILVMENYSNLIYYECRTFLYLGVHNTQEGKVKQRKVIVSIR
jgi:hypothetical protein